MCGLAIRLRVSYTLYECASFLLWLVCLTVYLLISSCAHHVTSVMWLWVEVPLLCMSSGWGGICPSPLMSSIYCIFDVLYIYGFFLVLLVWHTIRQYILPCTNRYILNSLLIVSTSNELQPHSRSLPAHSLANIN